MPPTLHVIFKTHLDLGFTGYAADVRRQYHEHFIPMALDTGENFLKEDAAQPMFVWTTGSWLIWDHLETQPAAKVERLERGIRAGIIRWHALPFTTHTELMSPALVREALAICAELDARFGTTTRAAKMTDVPGHTLGLVPLLAEAGVRFLHIGVNSASTPPDVPPVFRWRAPDGSEVVVMYQGEYGTTFVPERVRDGIAFAHTMDNMGPQNVGHVVDSHHALSEANPGFAVRASTLDAYADVLWAARQTLPVVTSEIADSWIHGVGSAPRRVSRYLAARRALDGFAKEPLSPQRRALARKLLEVPEHTWGVDIKTYLRDETAWDRPDFEAARRSDPRFAIAEGSWAEQDATIDDALSCLSAGDRRVAEDAAAPALVAGALAPVEVERSYQLGPFSVTVDPETGGLRSISRSDGLLLEAGERGLFAFEYESYDAKDYDAYFDSYLVIRPRWAILDHGKPGLENARAARSGRFSCTACSVIHDGDSLGTVATADPIAASELGAPAAVHTIYRAVDDRLHVTVTLPAKPANRMPEAGFVTFAPLADAESWRMQKLGMQLSPLDVIDGGNRQLHAVEAVTGVTGSRTAFRLATLDAPLFAPASQPFLEFARAQPDLTQGGRFNLFNNKWGTNFSMWCEGDLTYRFILELGAK